MVRESEVREGELAVEPPAARDAGLVFIGRIRTPWTSRLATPRQGRHDGPVCRLEIFEPWVPALKGVDFYSNLEVLYWLHQSRRDLVLQSPKNNKSTRGTFSLRSPVRPNPIGTSIVKLVGIEGRRCWCAASIVWTRRRCWISSPTAASSRRWRRRRPAISRRSERLRQGGYAPFNTAISLAALASSTLASSLRLAAGSSATPSWRGITCICR